ncbi:MraY family glycosyltransferase [Acetobacter pasteurianus]|nr:UDP-phosphate alpha-N-acetylglucosaminephosphotransferase [Acetobacter pasteurianus]
MPLSCTYSVAPAILEAAQPDDCLFMSFSFSCVAIFCLLGACVLSACLVRGMIGLAVMDTPGHRSAHDTPTPKGGGIGVMLAFAGVLPVLMYVTGQPLFSFSACALAAATLLLCAVSWLDDIYQWSPAIKFAAQCAAACIIVAGGIALPWPTPIIGAVLSVLWLIFITNAVNFMDGLNGLISGCLCVAALCMTAAATYLGVPALRWPALLMVFCLAGFLPFNFPNARIFLGDVGSQGCGLLAGAAALYTAAHSPLPSGWVVGPALLFPLIYDVIFTLIRRKLAGHSLVQAHRGHLYQVLHRSGIYAPAISLMEWTFTLWGMIVSCFVAPMPVMAGGITAFILVCVPQLVWTGFAVLRTRQHPVGAW